MDKDNPVKGFALDKKHEDKTLEGLDLDIDDVGLDVDEMDLGVDDFDL